MNKKLPEGWVWTSLGDIRLDKSKNIDPSKYPKEIFELYSVPNFDIGFPEIIGGQNIGSNKQIVEKNTVLLCKINPRINRVWVVGDHTNNKKIASTEWIPFFETNCIIPKYLRYFMNNNIFRNFLAANVSGVGGSLTRIKSRTFVNYPFPLPPLAEQQRIVNKIEELFTNLDKGIEYLKTAQAELKLTRQSVLKYAMEGKLTEKWREENKDKIEPASVLLERIKEERKKKTNEKIGIISPNNYEFTNLPSTWEVVTTGFLSYYITSGSRNWKNFYNNEGAMFIRTQDIAKNKLLLENVAHVKLPQKIEGKRSKVDKNDILVGITGHVGKVASVEYDIGEAYVSQSVALIKLLLPESAKFLSLCLITEGFGKTQIDKMVYGMGRPVLNLQNLREIFVPLPPLPEQHKIVQEIETYYSTLDNMENTISQSLNQTSGIRQSILKKAFEGRLVPQDPNEEPASVLLERIKAEKSKSEKEKISEKSNRFVKEKYRQMRID